MAQLDLNISVEKRYQPEIDTIRLERVVRNTLDFLKLDRPVELGLVITGDRKIRELNKKYRGLDRTTDVLSFGLTEAGEGGDFIMPPDGIWHAGEVMISLPRAKKQARDYNITMNEELARLAVHGVLHLLGYDHQQQAQRRKMREIEESILNEVGGWS